MTHSTEKEKGFTLIELMTALSIFVVVMTISMGSIISVFESSRKSRSLKTVLGNLNLAVETMSREMRFGKNYHCLETGTLTSPQNCPAGGAYVTFLSSESKQITYKLDSGRLKKKVDAGEYIEITAPEIIIDDMKFYTVGADSSDTLQPKIIMKIKSHAGTNTKDNSVFTLQTMISQRSVDL